MAAPKLQNSGGIDTMSLISALPSLAGLFTDKTTTGTQQTMLSPEANAAVLRQILGGSQGLASVTSGQGAAGLYNSTTNQMLTNDLITKAAGDVAVRSAPTVSSQTQQKQASPLKTVSSLLLPSLLKKSGLEDKVTSGIKSVFPSADAGTQPTAAEITNSLQGVPGSQSTATNLSDLVSQSADGGVSSTLTDSGLANVDLLGATNTADFGIGGGGTLGAAGDTALINPDIAASTASSGIDTASLLGDTSVATDTGTAVAGDTAATSGLSAAGATGWGALAAYGALNADEHIKQGNADVLTADVVGGLGSGNIVSAIDSGNVSDAAGPIGSSWVICTELHRQNLISTELYKIGALYSLTQLSPYTIAGYHLWAIPYVRLMKRSKLATRLVAPIAIKRSQYLAGQFNITGYLTCKLGHPLCYVLGKAVSYTQSYFGIYN